MNLKEVVRSLVLAAAEKAFKSGAFRSSEFPSVEIEEPKIEAHGDLSSNFAMQMASVQKMSPRKIAEALIAHLQDDAGILERAEIAGPGFINFFIRPDAWRFVLRQVHEMDTRYGASDLGGGRRIQVEFVSANPTGPLHVGHGRGAAVGDAVANILAFCGYDVQREYYINDSGRQIQTLGRSVFLRCRQQLGDPVALPADCYQGDYIKELAAELIRETGPDLLDQSDTEAVSACARFAASRILSGIRQDLTDFGVHFDNWHSEQSLFETGQVAGMIAQFKATGLIYEKDGALWFKTQDFGDEKDRVVVRANGQTTYFASDIAYHRDKYLRGMTHVIDVWGADHHGYINRLAAAIQALGYQRDQFAVILVQLVSLLRGGVPVAMSSRAGEFVTLKEVVDEVGRDAARFLFLTRHYESKLDFDLELAKQKTNDNPVYYVQYVHARIASIRLKARDMGIQADGAPDDAKAPLDAPEEIALFKTVALFPEVVDAAARQMEPHRITYYLMSLASGFHAYYNKHRVLSEDPRMTTARLCLVSAVQKIIRNGLTLLGVSSPEKM